MVYIKIIKTGVLNYYCMNKKCPANNAIITIGDNFCPACGFKIKWVEEK